MRKTQIILASSSPRRIALLKACGLKFKVCPPQIPEIARKGESAIKMVRRLAIEKAQAVAKATSHNNFLIIAADTCVVAPGKGEILGKPLNAADARRMLSKIQGRVHKVFTGYAILDKRSKKQIVHSAVVSSRVRIRKLTAEEIDRYVKTGEPLDKAGAYAAQGIGMAIIESIQGSYTNVVGLPLSELLRDLKSRFRIQVL